MYSVVRHGPTQPDLITRYSVYIFTTFVFLQSIAERILRHLYRGADKSLARPTSRCIWFDGENILFDASLVIYIYK